MQGRGPSNINCSGIVFVVRSQLTMNKYCLFQHPSGLWSAKSSLLTATIIFSCLVLVAATVLQKKQVYGKDTLTVKPYLDTVRENDQDFEVSMFSYNNYQMFQSIPSSWFGAGGGEGYSVTRPIRGCATSSKD